MHYGLDVHKLGIYFFNFLLTAQYARTSIVGMPLAVPSGIPWLWHPTYRFGRQPCQHDRRETPSRLIALVL